MLGEYKWEGLNKDKKVITGSDKVKSEIELKKLLRTRGIRATRIQPPSILEIDLNLWLVEKGFAKPFGAKDLLNFTKQLTVMVSAGVPILQSLQILYKQERNSSLKNSIKKIASEVTAGKSLSEAMSGQMGFDKLYCNLVKAGEVGGVLDVILTKLSTYLEKNEKIKDQIKSALTYPTIVVFVGALVIYMMLVFVVPKFTEMLTESGQQIPTITQIVINSSSFLENWTPIFVPTFIVGLVIFLKWTKTDSGKPIWDRITMGIPIFGSIIIKGSLSSFTRTLSTMLSSGVSLTDALEICCNTMDNTIIRNDLKKVKKAIEEGKTLADPIATINYFPEMIAQMIKIGEQTGNVDKMLERVADIFEKEVEDSIGTATKLIEPLILVGLGGIVAVILVAMYLPMFMSAGGSDGDGSSSNSPDSIER